MIIREHESWVRMLFIWRGSVLKKIIPQLATITLFACLVLYFKGTILDFKVHLNPAIFTLIGLALAIFMGFCNNASYDRFWEGRKLWGALVIESRSLTRQILTLVKSADPEDVPEQRYRVQMIAAFCWALNYQLREKQDTGQLDRLLQPADLELLKSKRFKPVILLNLLGEWINTQYRRGTIDSIVLTQLDNQLNHLSGIVGGCERISNTPLPFAYKLLLHRTVYMYCFWLPFGLVDVVDWMMPVMVLIISYTFIALDAIIQEISDPFGEEENDLALDSLCTTIEYSLFEQADIQQRPLEKQESFFIR